MKTEVELFRKQKKLIVDFVAKNGIDKVSLYSATCGIPLIVIYTFVAEDLPQHKEFAEAKIESLKKFYELRE